MSTKPEFIEFIHKASQMWCDKRVEDREMDGVFAQVVAEALSEAYAAGRAEVLARWPSEKEIEWEKHLYLDRAYQSMGKEKDAWRAAIDWLRNRLTIVNKDENEL